MRLSSRLDRVMIPTVYCIFGQRPASTLAAHFGVSRCIRANLTEFGVGVSIATSATADGVGHERPSEHHLSDVPIPGRRSP